METKRERWRLPFGDTEFYNLPSVSTFRVNLFCYLFCTFFFVNSLHIRCLSFCIWTSLHLQLFENGPCFCMFLNAPSHLYKRLGVSIRPSVRRSVRPSPVIFEGENWKVRLLGASCAVYPALLRTWFSCDAPVWNSLIEPALATMFNERSVSSPLPLPFICQSTCPLCFHPPQRTCYGTHFLLHSHLSVCTCYCTCSLPPSICQPARVIALAFSYTLICQPAPVIITLAPLISICQPTPDCQIASERNLWVWRQNWRQKSFQNKQKTENLKTKRQERRKS